MDIDVEWILEWTSISLEKWLDWAGRSQCPFLFRLPPVHPKSSGRSIVRELGKQGTKREKKLWKLWSPNIHLYLVFRGILKHKSIFKIPDDLQREYSFNVSRDPGRRLGEVWIRWDPSQTWSDWQYYGIICRADNLKERSFNREGGGWGISGNHTKYQTVESYIIFYFEYSLTNHAN